MKINNQVVVLTGASKGLGKALAIELSKLKSHLVLTSRSQNKLELLSKEAGGISFALDITDEQKVNQLADFALEKFGHIDYWINNAGVWVANHPITELDGKRVHAMFEVNVFGLIYGSKAALRVMQKQRSGTIINILSTSALEGRSGSSGYCASKFAARGFTDSLRLETQTDNIKVISVYPGGMKTGFFDEKRPDAYDSFMDPSFVAQKIVDNIKSEHPREELIIRRI